MKYSTAKDRRATIPGSVFLVLSLVFAALESRTQPAQSNNPANDAESPRVLKPEPSNDVRFYDRMEGIPFGVKEGMRMFDSDGRFRLAGPNDFKIPKWAIDRYGEELEGRLKFPVEGGRDINQDSVWYDYSAIVVDVTRSGPERFGLVIFNASGSENEPSTSHWLYRNRDFSRTFMHRLGEQLFVTDLFEDGTHTTCNIEWNKRLGQYSCE